ncbi:hypothetical protein KCP70_23375 [Salmonella enterica subsp. enterica]|nr:hypothetical protein KCP70_23375 [Salmonella enterica subsp. enterica]
MGIVFNVAIVARGALPAVSDAQGYQVMAKRSPNASGTAHPASRGHPDVPPDSAFSSVKCAVWQPPAGVPRITPARCLLFNAR